MATIHTDDIPTLDVREQITRIDKMQAELARIQIEIVKLKLDVGLEPWRIVLAAIAGTAALFGAATAFVKLVL